VLKDKLKSKLLGNPAEPSAPGGEPAAQSRPEDKLKEKLKKLF
jgi:hypothetical protein